jgi:hypothetical protein
MNNGGKWKRYARIYRNGATLLWRSWVFLLVLLKRTQVDLFLQACCSQHTERERERESCQSKQPKKLQMIMYLPSGGGGDRQKGGQTRNCRYGNTARYKNQTAQQTERAKQRITVSSSSSSGMWSIVGATTEALNWTMFRHGMVAMVTLGRKRLWGEGRTAASQSDRLTVRERRRNGQRGVDLPLSVPTSWTLFHLFGRALCPSCVPPRSSWNLFVQPKGVHSHSPPSTQPSIPPCLHTHLHTPPRLPPRLLSLPRARSIHPSASHHLFSLSHRSSSSCRVCIGVESITILPLHTHRNIPRMAVKMGVGKSGVKQIGFRRSPLLALPFFASLASSCYSPSPSV